MIWIEWIGGLYGAALIVAVLVGVYLRWLHARRRDRPDHPERDA